MPASGFISISIPSFPRPPGSTDMGSKRTKSSGHKTSTLNSTEMARCTPCRIVMKPHSFNLMLDQSRPKPLVCCYRKPSTRCRLTLRIWLCGRGNDDEMDSHITFNLGIIVQDGHVAFISAVAWNSQYCCVPSKFAPPRMTSQAPTLSSCLPTTWDSATQSSLPCPAL